MVLKSYAKTEKSKAMAAKKRLTELGLFDRDFPVKSDLRFVYFPVKSKTREFETIRLKAEKTTRKPKSIREALSGALSKKELDALGRSFDIIGEIAIIEVPARLEKKKRVIGKALLDTHLNVKTVFRKKGGRQGEYRVVPLELIAGKKNSETVYVEHGIRMKLDVAKVYFSPRLSEERRRIASLVKEGETVAGLFAGVGPFPLVIASQKRCTVYAVELNPVAVNYLRKNIDLNRRVLKGKIIPLEGDVKKIVKELPKCDRVLMPLPKGGEDFLGAALSVCKQGGVVHFYQFAPDKDLYSEALEKIQEAGKCAGRKIRVLNKKVVRPYAPRVSQVVVDFKLT